MDIELSKDANKVLSKIYKEYIKRIKSGENKSDAREFFGENWDKVFCPNLSKANYMDILSELNDNFGNMYIDWSGGFELPLKAVSYMENKPKNTVKNAIDLYSKMKP